MCNLASDRKSTSKPVPTLRRVPGSLGGPGGFTPDHGGVPGVAGARWSRPETRVAQKRETGTAGGSPPPPTGSRV